MLEVYKRHYPVWRTSAFWFANFAIYSILGQVSLVFAVGCKQLLDETDHHRLSAEYPEGQYYPGGNLVMYPALHDAYRATYRVRNDLGDIGAAFLIDDKGTIITAAHVVDEIMKNTDSKKGARLEKYNGIQFSLANLDVVFKPDRPKINQHPINYAAMNLPDLAILSVPDLSGSTFVQLAEYDLLGDDASDTINVILGNPGIDSIIFTTGRVQPFNSTEQTTRLTPNVLPGFSGGPVLDLSGVVVGMIWGSGSSSHDSSSMIPASVIRKVLLKERPLKPHPNSAQPRHSP